MKHIPRHKEEDIHTLILAIGDGIWSRGTRRLADWCGLSQKHVQFWYEHGQRIPTHWIEPAQQCCMHYAGKRVELRRDAKVSKMRKCLRCSKQFMSEDVGHRICDKCKEKKSYQEAVSASDEFKVLPK